MATISVGLTVHAARLREIGNDLSARAKKSATEAAASDNAGYIQMARMEAAVAAIAAMDAAAQAAAVAWCEGQEGKP